MKKLISNTGYCPTQNKIETIHVTYNDASSFEERNHYVKGMGSCPYLERGEECNLAISLNCPLMKDMPKYKDF